MIWLQVGSQRGGPGPRRPETVSQTLGVRLGRLVTTWSGVRHTWTMDRPQQALGPQLLPVDGAGPSLRAPQHAPFLGAVATGRARLAGMDALRLLALVAIVIGHVYTEDDWVDRFMQSWRLPLFFVISGYFWSCRRTLAQEVRKRSASLLVPYVVWMVLITVGLIALRWPQLELAEWSWDALLGGSYAPRPWTTMWFFTTLFVATVLYRLLARTKPWVRTAVVVAGLAVNLLFGAELARVPLSIATALGAVAFLFVGESVRRAQDHGAQWVRPRITVIVLFAAVMVALLLPGDFQPMDMKIGQFPPVAVGLAVVMCGALTALSTAVRQIPARLAAVLTAAAAPSLLVIAAHPFVLLALPPETTSVPLPLVVLVAFTLPLVLGLVVVRTPLARWLAGIPVVGRAAVSGGGRHRGDEQTRATTPP